MSVTTATTALPRRQVYFDLGESDQPTAYAWELRGGVACLVPHGSLHDNVASAPVHAALRMDNEEGFVEFCSDAALPPKILSAFLINLSHMRHLRRLRLSGHLTAASVAALCQLIKGSATSTLQSLECAYSDLPVALLESVAEILSMSDDTSTSLKRVQILSTSLSTQQQVKAFCQMVDELPHVEELDVQSPSLKHEKDNGAAGLLVNMMQHNFRGLRALCLPYETFAKHKEEWEQVLAALVASNSSTLKLLCIRQTVSIDKTINDACTPMDVFESLRRCLPPTSYLSTVDFGPDDSDEQEEWQVKWILPGGLRLCLVFAISEH